MFYGSNNKREKLSLFEIPNWHKWMIDECICAVCLRQDDKAKGLLNYKGKKRKIL